MNIPGFTAQVSLFPAAGSFREHPSLSISDGSVIPQLDSKDQIDLYDDDGRRVTVTLFTPVGPPSESSGDSSSGVPTFSEGFSSYWGVLYGSRTQAIVEYCQKLCWADYQAHKLACAIDENMRSCLAAAKTEYHSCKDFCVPD
jgi:hypothetical protein